MRLGLCFKTLREQLLSGRPFPTDCNLTRGQSPLRAGTRSSRCHHQCVFLPHPQLTTVQASVCLWGITSTLLQAQQCTELKVLNAFCEGFCCSLLRRPFMTCHNCQSGNVFYTKTESARILLLTTPTHTPPPSASLGPDVWAFQAHFPLSICSLSGLLVFQPPPRQCTLLLSLLQPDSPLLLRDGRTAHSPAAVHVSFCT